MICVVAIGEVVLLGQILPFLNDVRKTHPKSPAKQPLFGHLSEHCIKKVSHCLVFTQTLFAHFGNEHGVQQTPCWMKMFDNLGRA